MVFSSIQETIGFEIQLRDIPNGRPKTGSASLEGILHSSSGLLIGRREKSQISWNFWGQIRGKFQGKLRQRAIGNKQPILWLFSRQILVSLAIHRFCADQTSVFSIFLTEVIICSFKCSRNEPMAKSLTSWLVPSFSQHNRCLVVLERCLHVSVTKFEDKFASLQQVNSPNSWNKFQICRTDMYLIRFVLNFAVFCVFLWISRDLPEFRGSATARNIRSPDSWIDW